MNSTHILIHRAAQYLSAFGKNFVTHQEDDSHTNLAWDPEHWAFISRETDNGQRLELHLKDFSLQWKGKRNLRLGLQGRDHAEVVIWLHHAAIQNGFEEYEFHLHYRIASGPFKMNEVYTGLDAERLAQLADFRTAALQACEQMKEYFDFKSEVRTWPHHFDTGGYESLDGRGIGFGLAVPDSMIDDHYLYASAYKGEEKVSPSDYPPLQLGTWRDENFKGATVPVSGLEPSSYLEFFKEAVQVLLDRTKN